VNDLTAIMVDPQAFFGELKCCGFELQQTLRYFLGEVSGEIQMAPCFGVLSVILRRLWRHMKG
jgi:hypothetical protein